MTAFRLLDKSFRNAKPLVWATVSETCFSLLMSDELDMARSSFCEWRGMCPSKARLLFQLRTMSFNVMGLKVYLRSLTVTTNLNTLRLSSIEAAHEGRWRSFIPWEKYECNKFFRVEMQQLIRICWDLKATHLAVTRRLEHQQVIRSLGDVESLVSSMAVSCIGDFMARLGRLLIRAFNTWRWTGSIEVNMCDYSIWQLQ